MLNPATTYMDDVRQLVHYLAETMELGIVFRSSGNRSQCVYCDNDRGGDEIFDGV